MGPVKRGTGVTSSRGVSAPVSEASRALVPHACDGRLIWQVFQREGARRGGEAQEEAAGGHLGEGPSHARPQSRARQSTEIAKAGERPPSVLIFAVCACPWTDAGASARACRSRSSVRSGTRRLRLPQLPGYPRCAPRRPPVPRRAPPLTHGAATGEDQKLPQDAQAV